MALILQVPAAIMDQSGKSKTAESLRYEIVSYMICSCIFSAKGRFLLHNMRPFKTKAKRYAALSRGPTGCIMGFETRPCDVQTSNKKPSKYKDRVLEGEGRRQS